MKRKLSISEEDISLILQRYSASTIISLLQEVAQFPDTKIDWNELVKYTETGIGNAGEYRMLWRHLAYRAELGADSFEDDSDLETELEVFPSTSDEASAEAAACAEVLLGSRLPDDDGLLNCTTVEAPLTINIPNCQTPSVDLDNATAVCAQGKNITISVYVQREGGKSAGGGFCARKRMKPSTENEELEGSRSAVGGLPRRKNKKLWSEEEDLELIAAVQRYGESNWIDIANKHFNGNKTTGQVSQRWYIIKKHPDKLNSGVTRKLQLTEAQLATRRAVSHALNMPIVDSLFATRSGKEADAIQSRMQSSSTAVAENTCPGTQIQHTPHKGISNTTLKNPLSSASVMHKPVPPNHDAVIQPTEVSTGPISISSSCVQAPLKPLVSDGHDIHSISAPAPSKFLLGADPITQVRPVAVSAGPIIQSSSAPVPCNSLPGPNPMIQPTANPAKACIPSSHAPVLGKPLSGPDPVIQPTAVSARAHTRPTCAPVQSKSVSGPNPKIQPAAVSAGSHIPPIPTYGPRIPSNFSFAVPSNSMIKATAVASGARIASPSTAVSLLKAAQSKNAVHHIKAGVQSVMLEKPLSGTVNKSLSTNPKGHRPNVRRRQTVRITPPPPLSRSAPSPTVKPPPPTPVVTCSTPAVSNLSTNQTVSESLSFAEHLENILEDSGEDELMIDLSCLLDED
ncbi:hypothetical protein ACHQM5_016353 [Ranunculus cassubicifolius]